jgi:RNA polymerase sigma-70 factor (ECF subfamily)
MSTQSTDSFASRVTLVKETRRELEQQFEQILGEYGAAISRLAYSYEAVAGIREELTQEIALAIWQALPHFRGECSERTFIFRIAHNRGLTHVRRRRAPHQSLDELEEADEPVDTRPHPDEQLAQMNQRELLASAVQSLPIAHKQMIVLMLEDLSYTEIGEVLGITENNVAVRLTRSRKALKKAMGVSND